MCENSIGVDLDVDVVLGIQYASRFSIDFSRCAEYLWKAGE